MADSDPITQFFSDKEAESPDILYTTLSLQKSATAEEVRKAYRKLALKYHPDKHGSKSEKEKEELGKEFQKVGFAYAVLSDEKKRKRYDSTGRTDENAFSDAEEMGWEAYFTSLFERVDRKMLDDHKKKYQGSEDEKDDVIDAYNSSKGNLASILDSIPHAGIDDEERLVTLINSLIQDGTLTSNKKWASSSVDQGAKAKRAKSARKEAAEAEKSAKELGVWDEFYGEGKKGKRKADEANGAGEKNDSGESKGKGKGKRSKEDGEEEEENLGGLQALIQKRQQARGSFLDGMAEKYAKIESDSKAKKRKGKKGQQVEEGDGEEGGGPPDISDADFEALQAKMFNKKGAGKGKAK